MSKIDLSNISSAELEELLKKKKDQEHKAALEKRNAYEGIKEDLLKRVEKRIMNTSTNVLELFDFIVRETSAFYEVMKEYGQLRKGDRQMSYHINNDHFRIDVKTNKVKKFDERADIAAARLIEFLQGWIKSSDKGVDDPLYQLAMILLERNRQGDLDYKSISKLQDMKNKFNNEEYNDIMRLFEESNVVEGTATYFYFSHRTDLGVWKRIEISFNEMY